MFLDSKSQKSYALKSIAEELELHPISSKTADHTLFGGTQMSAESQIPNTDKCCRLTSAEQVALWIFRSRKNLWKHSEHT